MISYAQNFEDVILERIFADINKGCYVDIGACHPVYDSVTKHFYLKGWRGVNVEPISELFQLICEDRRDDHNLNCAVGSETGEATLFMTTSLANSTMNNSFAEAYKHGNQLTETATVDVKTLNQIIAETIGNAHINFLKIDVEGFEKQVLLGADWSQLAPDVLLIESTLPNSQEPSFHEWEHLLADSFTFFYFDGLNRFYHHKSFALDHSKASIPPNVFDDFKSYVLTNALNDVQVKETQLEESALALEDAYSAIKAKDDAFRELDGQSSRIGILSSNQLKTLTAEISQKQEALEHAQTALDKISVQIDHKEAELAEANNLNEALKNTLQEKERMLKDSEVSYKQLQATVTEHIDELASAQSALEDAYTSIAEKTKALKHAQTTLEQADEQIAQKNVALSEAANANAELQSALANAQSALDDAYTSIAEKTKALKHAQTTLEQADEQITQKNVALSEAANANADLQNALQNKETELKDCQAAYDQVQATVSGHVNALATAQSALDQADAAIAAKTEALEHAQITLEQADEQISQKNEALTEAANANADLQNVLQNKETLLKDCQTAYEQLQITVGEQIDAVVSAKSTLDQAYATIAEKTEALEHAQITLDQAGEQNCQKDLALSEAAHANECLQNTLEEKANLLKDADTSYQEMLNAKDEVIQQGSHERAALIAMVADKDAVIANATEAMNDAYEQLENKQLMLDESEKFIIDKQNQVSVLTECIEQLQQSLQTSQAYSTDLIAEINRKDNELETAIAALHDATKETDSNTDLSDETVSEQTDIAKATKD